MNTRPLTWFVSRLSISDGTRILEGNEFSNRYVCNASTPELAAQIVADHNAALVVGGQAAALEPAELSS